MDIHEHEALDDAAASGDAEERGSSSPPERARDDGDTERRLRRELARAREQAKAAVSDRDVAMAALQAESNGRLIRSELQLRALQNGIVDIDALRLLDTSAISIGADGAVIGAHEALEQFRSAKPYLFEQGRSGPGYVTTSSAQRAPAPAQAQAVDARNLTRDQWQAERARLLSRSR